LGVVRSLQQQAEMVQMNFVHEGGDFLRSKVVAGRGLRRSLNGYVVLCWLQWWDGTQVSLLFLLLLLMLHGSNAQQAYNNVNGYTCAAAESQGCTSYTLYRTQSSKEDLTTVSTLFNTPTSIIAEISGLNLTTSSLPVGTPLYIPLACNCVQNSYQGNVSRTYQAISVSLQIVSGNTFWLLANNTYAGLTTYQAIEAANPTLVPTDLQIGTQVTIPLRCACPSATQNGTISLLSFVLFPNENFSIVSSYFNVSHTDLGTANEITVSTPLQPFTTLLIPLVNLPPLPSIKFISRNPPSTSFPSSKLKKRRLVLPVLISIFLVSVGSFLGVLFFKKKLWRQLHLVDVSRNIAQYNFNDLEGLSKGPHKFSYKELKIATNSFNPQHLLGHGGFGSVYKGTLQDTGVMIAVKKIDQNSKQGGREFFAEVSIISRIKHRNLVQLQGWCCERGQLMIVYDYMPNKSLDKILFHDREGKIIDFTWDLRNNVLIGVASALAYLHEEWEQCVVHRDVKPSNVMLDQDFNPRLGDFGLARLITPTKSAQTTMLAGTIGYMAPELATTCKATTNSDVFSYGILALEVVSGRHCFDRKVPEEEMILLDWVWKCYENEELFKVVDSKLMFNIQEEGSIRMALLLGLLCTHPDPNARPTMGYVRQVLAGNANLPTLPLHKPVVSYSSMNVTMFHDLINSLQQEGSNKSFELNEF
jgi:interleukin-1 receptor-associated kinase 1